MRANSVGADAGSPAADSGGRTNRNRSRNETAFRSIGRDPKTRRPMLPENLLPAPGGGVCLLGGGRCRSRPEAAGDEPGRAPEGNANGQAGEFRPVALVADRKVGGTWRKVADNPRQVKRK